MKHTLRFAAVLEIATGLALLIVPSLVVLLLLGGELTGVAVPVARVLGIALIALGFACGPGSPLSGMLIYSAAATLFLGYGAFMGRFGGILLWPVVAVHGILTVMLVLVWFRIQFTAPANEYVKR